MNIKEFETIERELTARLSRGIFNMLVALGDSAGNVDMVSVKPDIDAWRAQKDARLAA